MHVDFFKEVSVQKACIVYIPMIKICLNRQDLKFNYVKILKKQAHASTKMDAPLPMVEASSGTNDNLRLMNMSEKL